MATTEIRQIGIDAYDLADQTSYHHGMSDYRDHCDAAYVMRLANLVTALARRVEELENALTAQRGAQ